MKCSLKLGRAGEWLPGRFPALRPAEPTMNKKQDSIQRISDYDIERRAALAMVQAGLASPSEVAKLAGVGFSLVQYWLKAADITWRVKRDVHLSKKWRQAIGKAK